MTDLLEMLGIEHEAHARATDPVSSHEAAEQASTHVWESQQAALAILEMWGKPVTALQLEEIAAARGVAFSAARMRSTLSELESKGLVKREGFTSPPTGRRRQLWRLVGRADVQ